MRIRVDPRKVHTVEMRDGTQYPVGRNGWVDINHPKHERELALHGAPEAAETGYLTPRVGVVSSAGKSCPCGSYTGWPWSTECPRCGRSF